MRDRLVAAVLAGEKIATSALLVQYEQEREPLPSAGELEVMVGSAGEDGALVEIIEVSIVRLGEVDERVALDEGERASFGCGMANGAEAVLAARDSADALAPRLHSTTTRGSSCSAFASSSTAAAEPSW